MARMPIYMDHNATTPVDPQVAAAMAPCLTEQFGNPASHTHPFGWVAAKLVDRARQQIAASIGAHPEEIVFTSGATEANNLAIKGFAWSLKEGKGEIITCATEHRAVLDPCHRLAAEGFSVKVLAVDGHGRPPASCRGVSRRPHGAGLGDARQQRDRHDPAEIAAIARECGAALPLRRDPGGRKTDRGGRRARRRHDVVLAHKLYGPKGIGALYVRRRRPRLRLVPLLDGGGHEEGLRSGTLNVPAIVGFAKALELSLAVLVPESRRLAHLRDASQRRITARLAGVIENGHPRERLPNTLNLSFSG